MEKLEQIERLWGNPRLSPEPLLADVRWLIEEVRLRRSEVQRLHDEIARLQAEQAGKEALAHRRFEERARGASEPTQSEAR